ncbi:MAG: hypothetical protein KC503_38625 [Myxococcales bacterium]|nr:hypothetical protein [Myxococcales bacterium]
MIALAIYVVICLAALIWPGYPLVAGALGPRVLGLPTALVWNVGWVSATFVVMLVVERRQRARERQREHDRAGEQSRP